MKKVSIIIPCYNQGKYIADAINSALNQTYTNTEIICINDASTDNTADIIKSFSEKHNNIIFINQKDNQGVIDTRDYAIKMSTGDYILPLDADDTIENTFIEKAVNILESNSEIGIVYSNYKYFGTQNKIIKLPDFSTETLALDNYIPNTSLFRKLDYLKTKGYNPNMKDGYENWDLWLSIIELGLKGYKIDEILFNYRIHSNTQNNNISEDKINIIKKQIFKNHYNLYMKIDNFITNAFKKREETNTKYECLYKYVSSILIFSIILNIALIFVLFK